ncbi:MAG: ABC transporter permease subunit, partial [Clostridiales Family XIII bacterium]|nr:ABC transporter permease subunit [Clostridiales Family XIII bacterium]
MSRASNLKYALSAAITVLGFAAAGAVDFFLPDRQEELAHPAFRVTLALLIAYYLIMGAWAARSVEKREKYVERVPFRLAIGLVVAVWDLLSAKLDLLVMPFFPSPVRVMAVFVDEPAFLLTNLLYSLRLFAVGFSCGIALGIGTGILVGWFAKVNYWVMPPLKITGIIPAVAWMPFALTLLPTSFAAGAFLIVICAWFPVAFMTSQGIALTQKVYFDVAKTLGAKTSFLLFRVALPNALPQIFTGISTASALAFTTLVISEMMGAQGGLGYYINWA